MRCGNAGQRMRILGSGHSFNDCAATPDVLVSSAFLTTIHGIDTDAMTVRVESGVTFGELIRFVMPSVFVEATCCL